MASNLTLRPPSTSNGTQPAEFSPPTTAWLKGTWHVSYSTLPMWKSKKNVQITYTPLPPSTPQAAPSSGASGAGGSESVAATAETAGSAETDRIDDLVTYQPLESNKTKSVHGVDKMSGGDARAWDWRGKGWLAIASSHWEVLGHGAAKRAGVRSEAAAAPATGTAGAEGGGSDADEPEEWVVTYFAKTLFTPAGIDVYCRPKPRLSGQMVEVIKEALAKVEDEEFTKLAGQLFEIKHD